MQVKLNIPAARLAVGLGQGLLLFALYQCALHGVWPATRPYVFFPLVSIVLFTPIVAVVGMGNLRRRTLLTWLGFLVALLTGVLVYFVYKYDPGVASITFSGPDPDELITLFLALIVAIFVAHTLLVTYDAHALTFYPRHFDLGWKHAIQLVAAGLFVLAFWLLIFLGQALFNLVGLDPFTYFIEEPWFVIPVTTLVVSASLHITDVRPAIIAGIRTLALTLLSWLLPIITAITVAFLLVLPFTGLSLLWDTGRASAVLLSVATVLIVLINAAYQDGTPQHAPAKVLRYATNAAALALTPLALITAYALFLRINQYGWTVDRVFAVTYAGLTLGYAAGYGWAVVRRGPWIAFLERCNVAMALVTVAAIVLLYSPVADPERIAVSSQISRFMADKDPEKLDVLFLRFSTGRFGIAALEKLRDGGVVDDALKERIQVALDATERWAPQLAERARLPEGLAVLPDGKVLPESFVQQDWGVARDHLVPGCMRGEETAVCRALMIDLDGDAVDEIALVSAQGEAPLYKLGADGQWHLAGYVSAGIACAPMLEPLRRGEAKAAAAKWQDIVIGERRFTFHAAAGPLGCE